MRFSKCCLSCAFAVAVSFPVSGSGDINTIVGNLNQNGHPAVEIALQQGPQGVVALPDGTLYVAALCQVYRIDPSGTVALVAGKDLTGFAGDGGPATEASFGYITDIAMDAAGNLYISDTNNHRVRKVSPSGTVTVFAGNGTGWGSGDGGPAVDARVGPRGLAIDATGNVYIGDYSSQRSVVRMVNPTGIISTVAGIGPRGFTGDGGPATSARLDDPRGVDVDAMGNLYIADMKNNRIRKVDTSGIISTIAGNGTFGYGGDLGLAVDASMSYPNDVSIDDWGNLYIADQFNNRIRKVDTAGIISTIVGDGTNAFSGDGGPASLAQIGVPNRVTIGGGGTLLVADQYNYRVRHIDEQGIISTVAGNGFSRYFGENILAIDAGIGPRGVAIDVGGNVYIADGGSCTIRRVDASSGIIQTFAGDGTCGHSGDGGPALDASMGTPYDIALDTTGNLYISVAGGNRVRKVDPSGIITTVAGNGSAYPYLDGVPATTTGLMPKGIGVDRDGNLLIVDHCHVSKVDASGVITRIVGRETGYASLMCGFAGDSGPALQGKLSGPEDVAADTDGNIYIADYGNNRIRKVDHQGTITTVAGNGTMGFSGDGGPATNASLSHAHRLAVDDDGNVYIADRGNHRIRKLSRFGIIRTAVGNGDWAYAGDGGPAIDASLRTTANVAVDAAGNIYSVDSFRIRKITKPPDLDDDGAPDAQDNCPAITNPWQENVDGDSYGDVCDPCPADAQDSCNPDGSTAEVIDAEEGGALVTPDGEMTVDVPAEALGSDTTLSVTETVFNDPAADLALSTGGGLGLRLKVYDLQPDGVYFSVPVTITIIADVSTLNPQQLINLSLYFENSSGVLEPLAGSTCDVVEGTATCVAAITHFSVYAIVAPADGDGDGIFDLFDQIVDICPNDANLIEGFMEPMTQLTPEVGDTVFPDQAFQSSRTIPMKFGYSCGTVPVTDADGVSPPQLLTVWRVGDADPLPVIDPDSGEANDSDVWFRNNGQHWIYNYSTKGHPSGTYEVHLRMPDGRVFKGGFHLR